MSYYQWLMLMIKYHGLLTVIALMSDSCPENVCLHIPSRMSHNCNKLQASMHIRFTSSLVRQNTHILPWWDFTLIYANGFCQIFWHLYKYRIFDKNFEVHTMIFFFISFQTVFVIIQITISHNKKTCNRSWHILKDSIKLTAT